MRGTGGMNPSPTVGGRFAANVVEGGVPDAPRSRSLRTIRRAACPQAAVPVCGDGGYPGGMNPSPTVSGKFAAKDVGGGVPDAPRRGQAPSLRCKR